MYAPAVGKIRISALCALLAYGCSDAASPATEVRPDPAERAPAQTGSPPAAPATPAVDLLHAVSAEVAVSSVYRDQASQAAHLVDGDAETAWNSRTGELVGAFIEVRLPANVEVESVALIPGFARVRGDNDLFLGNHRVARVRVLRDGAEVGTFPVDTSSRTLVRLPVRGGGGVYRIEVTEVLPGSRPSWQETCISELAIFGRAPDARAGSRLPRTGVGTLPPPRPDASTLDRAAVGASLRRELTQLTSTWNGLAREITSLEENTGEPYPDEYLVAEFERMRDSMLARAATLTEVIDPALSDGLRIRHAMAVQWSSYRERRSVLAADLDALGAAFAAVAAWLGDDEARCKTARGFASLRLARIARFAHTASYFDEINESEALMMDETPSRRAERRSRALASDDERLDTLARAWGQGSPDVAARILAHREPTDEGARVEWRTLRAEVALAQRTCGWTAPAP